MQVTSGHRRKYRKTYNVTDAHLDRFRRMSEPYDYTILTVAHRARSAGHDDVAMKIVEWRTAWYMEPEQNNATDQ